MKLLPHFFKWIGLALFFSGFILAFDDVRLGFLEGYSQTTVENFERFFPVYFSILGDFASLLGLLLYILSKNKSEDEFAQKLRYESAFLVMVFTILTLMVIYIVNPDFEISPSTFLASQMFAYLIIRSLKRKVILGVGDYEE